MDEKLLEKAEELGLDVNEDTTEEELQSLIDAKTEELDAKGKKSGDPEESAEYYKSEAKKAYEARDKVKKERRRLAAQLRELQDKIDQAPNVDEYKKLEEELAALRDFKKEIEDEREAKELEQKTEVEKTKIRFEKQLQELQDRMTEIENSKKQIEEEKERALKEKETEISQLRMGTLEAEVMKVANKLNAYNPTQIYRLLKDEFTFDQTIGAFTKLIKEKGKIVDELSVEEVVTKFLEDPNNDNLVKSKVKRGMKSDELNSGESSKGKKNDYKDYGYDPKDETIKRKADLAGLSPEDYIYTLILRDKKKKLIEEKRAEMQG